MDELMMPRMGFAVEAVVCPECGGTAMRTFRGDTGTRQKYWHWIECYDCGAHMSIVGLGDDFQPLDIISGLSKFYRINEAMRHLMNAGIISWPMREAIMDMLRRHWLSDEENIAPDSDG